MYFIYLVTIATCFSVAEFQQKIVFVNNSKTWHAANRDCINTFNGSLVEEDVLERISDAASSEGCINKSASYWTGNVEVVTPYIWLKGCIGRVFLTQDDSLIYRNKEMSVEICAAYCANYSGFEIQVDKCRCINRYQELSNSSEASACTQRCKDPEQYCGGENMSNVYVFRRNVSLVGSNPPITYDGDCLFAFCDESGNGKLATDKCMVNIHTSLNTIVCEGNYTHFSDYNATNWMSASSHCVSTFDSYLVGNMDNINCSKFCPASENVGCNSIWTGTRRYKGTINATTTELEGNKTCFMAVDNGEKEPIISTPYGTDTKPPERSNSSVTDQSHESTGKHRETTPSLENVISQSRPEATSSQIGVIVGAIVAVLGLFAAVTIAVFIILKRKRQSKEAKYLPNSQVEKHAAIPDKTENNQSEKVYMDARGDEYDQLRSRRRYISDKGSILEGDKNCEKGSPFYDHIDNKNKSETHGNTYDAVLKSTSSCDVDDTYSHAKGSQAASKEGHYDLAHHGDNVVAETDNYNYGSCSK